MFVNIIFFIVFPMLAVLALGVVGAAVPVFGRLIMSSSGLFALMLILVMKDRSVWPDSVWMAYIYFGLMGAVATYGLMFLWQTLRRFGLPLLDTWFGIKVAEWTSPLVGIDFDHATKLSESFVIMLLAMAGLGLSLLVTHHLRPALSLGEEPKPKE